MARPIFFLTDFGLRDAYVGICEAQILRVAPGARVVHLAHEVPPQDLRNASYQLFSASPQLPDGSVVLAVVDPGVGSSRDAVAVEGERLAYVGPDNGLFEAAFTLDPPRRAHRLENPKYRRAGDVSSTFHGRDVFSPAAAHLAAGVPVAELGPAIDPDDLVRLGVLPTSDPIGEIWTFDRFGNAITTLLADPPVTGLVAESGAVLRLATTYADVPPGEPLALVGSTGLLEISLRNGSARRRLNLEAGHRVVRQPRGPHELGRSGPNIG
jgi:S-adenosylmethionine hydrolase